MEERIETCRTCVNNSKWTCVRDGREIFDIAAYPASGCPLGLWQIAPEYMPQHEIRQAFILPAEKKSVRRELPCINLGKLVHRKKCPCRRDDSYICDKGHGTVSQNGKCEECNDYDT